MSADESRARGHWPSLVAGFLYFDLSLMVWVMLGATGSALSDALGLTPGQTGAMVALPILTGLCLRPLAGLLADRFGPRRIALAGLGLSALPLLLGWLWITTFAQVMVVGGLLGVAGASFAVALPMAGRGYPAGRQGLVLGLVGAGNSGAAMAALLAPLLVSLAGWRGVFGLALIPLAVAFVAVAALARDSAAPVHRPSLGEALKALGRRDTCWLCVFYALTFGGLAGTVSFLSLFFRDQYEVDPIQAGTIAALFAMAGSLARPIGGFLADRHGGTSVLFLAYVGLGLLGLRMSYIPHLEVALSSLMLMLVMMGIGNGAVFQIIPERFPDAMGTVTGMVGAAGGLGAFLLPLLMGYSRDWLGWFGPAFFAIGLSGFFAAGLLVQVSRQWHAPAAVALSSGKPRRDVEVVAQS
jgi:NNP family nitrate/nitrite transporter-like MFS transporter